MKKIQLVICLIIFNLYAIAQPCDPSKLPTVFVHGFLGSADAKDIEPIYIYFNDRNYMLPKRKLGLKGVMVLN